MERELWPLLYHTLRAAAKDFANGGSALAAGTRGPVCRLYVEHPLGILRNSGQS